MSHLKNKKIELAGKMYNQTKGSQTSKMINGTVKPSQKGKGSLESVKNDKDMMAAGNEHNRS